MEPVAYVDGLPVAARAPDALHTNIQVANVKIRAVMAMIDDRHDGRVSNSWDYIFRFLWQMLMVWKQS